MFCLLQVQIWRRFTRLEWLFIVVAAVTVLPVLGISIGQFFFLHQKFMFIEDGPYDPYNPNPYNLNYFCNNWTCTNDFIFNVTLVINVGKIHNVHSVQHSSKSPYTYFKSSSYYNPLSHCTPEKRRR